MYNKDAHCYGNVAFPEMTMPMDHECDDHVGGFSHMTCPEMAMPMPMPMPMPMRHEYDDRFYGGCGCYPTCGGCSGCGCECGPTCGCVMDPIVEPMIQRCCQREFVHEVPHVCPINTKIINHHIYRHTYEPCYTCCEENVLTNVSLGSCCQF